MLDVVKELIPLVEGAGEGAFWLIFMFFSVTVVEVLIWAITIVLIAMQVGKAIKWMTTREQDLMNTITTSEHTYRLSTRSVNNLLTAIARVDSDSDGEITSRHIDRFIAKIDGLATK